jgi:hypothetical protein
MRQPSRHLARAPLIALILGGLLLPSSATAKVTCAKPLEAKARVLVGMPPAPETGATYHTTIVTSTRHPVNPEPLLFLARCEGREDRQFVQLTPEEPGGGAVRSSYSVTFKRTGRWIAVLMDRSGTFYNVGKYDVSAPSKAEREAGAGEGEDVGGLGVSLVVGLGAIVGGAVLVGRRLRGA